MINQPWYQTACRWMQTNLTETDPENCDVAFWRKLWRENSIQGIIVNSGGIVAYYPSEHPLQYRASTLGSRDLLKEFVDLAREEGIAVLARMDVNRANEAFYAAHPDWFSVDAKGNPYRTNDGRYYSCINGGYYTEHIPRIMQEIAEKYHPDGFTDNSWTGMGPNKICYCEACKKEFFKACGCDLPVKCDYNDSVYRRWILWSLTRRTHIWDLFNEITARYGGEDCLWLGMMNANPTAPYFCDLIEIAKRSKIVMSDYQARDELNGFEQNGIYGSVLSNLTGYDKIHPESVANYVRGRRVFRLCSNPKEETQLWLAEGMAGQLSPWLHFVGGCPEDRRQLENCTELMSWHKQNEAYLYHREPVSDVALLWSQQNTLFYGRNEPQSRVALPWRGFTRALTAGRIPYQPVNLSLFEKEMSRYRVVILPDLAVVGEQEEQALHTFIKNGGSIVYTGASGFLTGDGATRDTPAFDELLGIRRNASEIKPMPIQGDWMDESRHSYLRLPKERNTILGGFENTDILPFGGILYVADAQKRYDRVCTYIPPFPIYPPELSCMTVQKTDVPVIVAGKTDFGGRVVYFAGDIDRCCGQMNNPDHRKLLEQAVRYAANNTFPIDVTGKGYLDCRLYRQQNRLILQIVNLTGCNRVPDYVTEFSAVTDSTVTIDVSGWEPSMVRSRITGERLAFKLENKKLKFTVPTIEMQEFFVIE